VHRRVSSGYILAGSVEGGLAVRKGAPPPPLAAAAWRSYWHYLWSSQEAGRTFGFKSLGHYSMTTEPNVTIREVLDALVQRACVRALGGEV
jgi:hypothetical protein